MVVVTDENSDVSDKLEVLRDLPVTLDDPSFSPDEMVACPGCARRNPPNRFSCLYCGAGLAAADVRPDIAKINLQPPELWEDGYSLVDPAKEALSSETIDAAAEITMLDRETFGRLVANKAYLPLVYMRSLPDAQHLATRLAETGFACAIIGDDLLAPQVPPTRIRAIEFTADGLLLEDFNTSRKIAVTDDDRVFIVRGSLVKMRIVEFGKRKKKTVTTTDSSETVSDEPVLDIYPAADVFGFRIRASGFDFSCLRERMEKLAAANMTALAEKLRTRLPSSVFTDAYETAASLVEQIWPAVQRNESSRVSRGTFGQVRTRNITVSDNTIQFTKFSRLQRHLI